MRPIYIVQTSNVYSCCIVDEIITYDETEARKIYVLHFNNIASYLGSGHWVKLTKIYEENGSITSETIKEN